MIEDKISGRLDLRGVMCPINLVQIKLKMKEIENDSILEIVLDNGEPMQNVPRSIKEEGHRIVEVEKLPEGCYKLLVRKGAGV
ncbi:sulfurtransferase TusA family protein [Candidatus Methanoperedens nitratireducens]|uniref:Similar to response regulator sirA n=1 Tax=Candidatus Methanoperedens nitratireducens TaxID=1392998 RepID=A0A284VRX5_9EURY|nr:sulfurtransferase TusA family protein [Candidatus Methanoperedens nitroreducens]SNQ62022.1 Similar to response regulator sirA [Candidatus Methanoperedens nitroreducens]